MKRWVVSFWVAMTALVIGCNSTERSEDLQSTIADLIVANTTVVGGPGFTTLEGVDVLITEGMITEVVKHSPTPKATRVINGTGKFVVPGFIDAHTHPFPVGRSFPQFIHYGVTGILVTGCSLCTNERLAELRARGEDASQIAPRVFHTSQHFTMEGRHPVKTYPTPNWVEGRSVFYLRELSDIAGFVEQVAKQPNVGIKLTIEKGPNPPFVEPMPLSFVAEVVKQAHARHIEVFAHVSDNEGLKVAHKAGVDHLVHFTGVDLEWATHAGIVDDFLEKDLHWVTTLMLDKSFLYPINPAWTEAVKRTGMFDLELSSLRVRGMSAEAAQRFAKSAYGEINPSFTSNPVLLKQFDDLRKLHARGIKLVTGTDVSNSYILPGYSLHEEMLLLEQGGFAPLDILQMATLNAAELVGAQALLGSVEPGKHADLVILHRDPAEKVAHFSDIAFVLKGGFPLRTP